jgi:hypothetical protein
MVTKNSEGSETDPIWKMLEFVKSQLKCIAIASAARPV